MTSPSLSLSKALPPRAESLLESITARRSFYKLGNGNGNGSDGASVSDADLVQLVSEVVKQTPSAFNSQTSRVIILLGDEHKSYWSDTITPAFQAVSPPDVFSSQEPRFKSFAAAKGTLLIFEDLASVAELGARNPFVKDFTHGWSLQSSGMLQVNLWNFVTALGFGANLQHVGPMVGVEAKIKDKWLKGKNHEQEKEHAAADQWKLNAELVFGTREGDPKEKGFTDRHRIYAFGAEKQ